MLLPPRAKIRAERRERTRHRPAIHRRWQRGQPAVAAQRRLQNCEQPRAKVVKPRRTKRERAKFAARAHNRRRDLAFYLVAFDDAMAQVQQNFRNRNLDRTNLRARAAQRRRERQVTGDFCAKQLRRQDRADGSGIRAAVRVPADVVVDRADIEARAAADAQQRLARAFVLQNSRASVVEQDQMKLTRTFFRHASDKTDVRRHLLPGRAAR